jgi:hypothetical protein
MESMAARLAATATAWAPALVAVRWDRAADVDRARQICRRVRDKATSCKPVSAAPLMVFAMVRVRAARAAVVVA